MNLHWFTYSQSLTFAVFIFLAVVALHFAKNTVAGTYLNNVANMIFYVIFFGVFFVGLWVLFH